MDERGSATSICSRPARPAHRQHPADVGPTNTIALKLPLQGDFGLRHFQSGSAFQRIAEPLVFLFFSQFRTENRFALFLELL
jgi:hypothetical protein